MSKILKIIIITLLFIFVSVVIFALFFLNIFKINNFDFINTLQEQKYTKEMTEISKILDNQLNSKNETIIDPFIKKIDFSKFEDRKKAKGYKVSEEVSLGKDFIVKNDFIVRIKYFDNTGKIIFSTDDKERKGKTDYLSFVSLDNIEKNKDFYNFKPEKNSYIVDPQTNSLILKKNIISSNNSIGVLLFYYNNKFLFDLLRMNNFTEFGSPELINNSIIVLDLPINVDKSKIENINLEKKNTASIISRDKNFGNEFNRTYRILNVELQKNNLYITRFIKSDIFRMDFNIIILLYFLSVFTLYLLVIAVLLFLEGSELTKVRGRASLFTATLLEEIVNAKSKDELEKIQRRLGIKKENTYNLLIKDNKKLKPRDADTLKNQIELVFNKIEETLETKLKDISGGGNLDKVEMLLEKFVSTIAEKGIQVSSPIKVKQTQKKMEPIEVEEVEEAEAVEELGEAVEVEDVEEAEAVEELGEAVEVEEVEEAEAVEELGEAVEVEEVEEAEAVEELGEAVEVEEVEEAEAVEELGEAVEVEEVEEVEVIEVSEIKEELDKVEEFIDEDEFDEFEEDEELSKLEEIDELKIDELENLEFKNNKKIIEDEKQNIIEKSIEADELIEEDLPDEIETIPQDVKEDDLEELNLELEEEADDVEMLEEVDEDDVKKYKIHDEVEEKIKDTAEQAKLINKNKDVTIDNLFDSRVEKLRETDVYEEKATEEDVPKVPKEYYDGNQKDDKLAKEIKELFLEKTPLQLILEDVYKNMDVDKLSLLINTKSNYSFMQINQIGYEFNKIEKIILNKDNPLVKHLFETQRLVFVSNTKKLNQICNNENFENSYKDMQSLFIYPIKHFRKIRSLILLFFKGDKSNDLELMIDIIEKNKNKLRKNILKIV